MCICVGFCCIFSSCFLFSLFFFAIFDFFVVEREIEKLFELGKKLMCVCDFVYRKWARKERMKMNKG